MLSSMRVTPMRVVCAMFVVLAAGQGIGIFESDLRRIFGDPENRDYRLRPGSPAITAGTETGSTKDIVGTPVPLSHHVTATS